MSVFLVMSWPSSEMHFFGDQAWPAVCLCSVPPWLCCTHVQLSDRLLWGRELFTQYLVRRTVGSAQNPWLCDVCGTGATDYFTPFTLYLVGVYALNVLVLSVSASVRFLSVHAHVRAGAYVFSQLFAACLWSQARLVLRECLRELRLVLQWCALAVIYGGVVPCCAALALSGIILPLSNKPLTAFDPVRGRCLTR